jgi:peroxiredoxin
VLLPAAGTSGRATFVVGKDGRLTHIDVSDDIERVPSLDRVLAALASA